VKYYRIIVLHRSSCTQQAMRPRPAATDDAHSVVCVSVCVLSTCVSCAKMAEEIEIPFGDDSYRSKEPSFMY